MADEWKEQYDYYFDKVNNANVESAKKQMDFQERMSSTAHQREVADLIKAGLNPVLSANNGASSPMGAYANVDSSPISAKFARQNLNKELENARLITQMQNENQMQIAMAQLANQMELGKYTVDENNKTTIMKAMVDKYGILAGLAYGFSNDLLHDKVTGSSLADQAGAILGNSATVQNLLGSIGNSAKNSQDVQERTDELLDKAAQILGYSDNKNYNYSKLADKAFNKIHWSFAKGNNQSLPNLIKKSMGKQEHKKAFNKFKPSKSYW